MVMELFDSLIDEFSKATEIPDLKPDANNSCLISLPDGTQVQMELDTGIKYFILGAELGFLPSGRYRETVLKEALRANGLPPPHTGEFAYSKKVDKLILFMQLPLKNLNGEKIASAFGPFAEKAGIWREAIQKGEVPSILGAFSTRQGGTGMFGL